MYSQRCLTYQFSRVGCRWLWSTVFKPFATLLRNWLCTSSMVCLSVLHINPAYKAEPNPSPKSCQRNSNLRFSRNFPDLASYQWVKCVQLATYVYPVPSWIRHCKLYCFSFININWQIVHCDNSVLFIFPSDFKRRKELAKTLPNINCLSLATFCTD